MSFGFKARNVFPLWNSYPTSVNFTSKTTWEPNAANKQVKLLNISQNSVIISQSRDIYENLALEDWLYKNHNFTSKNMFILLLWYNAPSVVIGRHQNPWVECSVDYCNAFGVKIARRNSGGGTVYHDYGNVNCSFLTPREMYNRKSNLQIICDSILKKWSINLRISERHDILYNNEYKVSGTASKLGRTNAYHHCTVLVDVDEEKLQRALHRDLAKDCIESKATSSLRAKVKNLKSVCPDLDVGNLIHAVAEQYKQYYNIQDENVLSIAPNEDTCPGITPIKEGLMSWEWCFGHTPRFIVTKSFPLCVPSSEYRIEKLPSHITVKLVMNKGSIEDISLEPQILEEQNFHFLHKCIIGSPFTYAVEKSIKTWVNYSSNEILTRFLKSCLLELVSIVYR